MNENNKKVRDYLEKEEVPEKLSPENIAEMLSENAPQKKRKNISAAGRIAALAAACVVIVGGTVHFAGQKNLFNKKQNTPDTVIKTDNQDSGNSKDDDSETTTKANTENPTEQVVVKSYMNGAESYEQIYTMFEKSAKRYNKKYNSTRSYGAKSNGFTDDVIEYAVEESGDDSEGVYYDNSEVLAPKTNSDMYDSQMNGAVGGMGGDISPNDEFIAAPKNSDEEPTEEPTQEITETPTEEPTEEPTQEITETPTEEQTEEPTEEITETPTEEQTEEPTEESAVTSTESTNLSTSAITSTVTSATTAVTTETAEDDFSDTYSQEENVREADIVKTDGKNIYYIRNNYNYNGIDWTNECVPQMNIVSVDSGKFVNPHTVDLTPDMSRFGDGYSKSATVQDMYIYNDMLIVIGSESSYYDVDYYYTDGNGDVLDDSAWFDRSSGCFVSFYTHEAEPKLIGTYYQDGYYNDVRISPDGYMYLVSNHSTATFENVRSQENTGRYIPSCGTGQDIEFMPPEDILLPKRFSDESDTIEYTVIGGIDLTEKGTFKPVETKALAGYTGQLYMSENNIYTSANDYSSDITETEITRISVNQGNIDPQASGNVMGYIKDQFSMSEYDGYLRVAATRRGTLKDGGIISDMFGTTEYEYINDNCVYVLDMDMNIVGTADGLGENETIKSVNFSGNMGYVVTYRQTDPLYAIDFSNPESPVVLDEYKILGYSNYMQSWTEGLLLGFGADADEDGIETGVKLVMFDNSDPENLKEVGYYSINHDDDGYIYSNAMWDRKSLLISPEKNIIGVPINEYHYYDYYYDDAEESEDDYASYSNVSKYMFFSYNDGNFELIGELKCNGDLTTLERAIYIGNYVYALSENTFVAADMKTLKETDRIKF